MGHHYPSLSRDGASVVTGDTVITIDQATTVGAGRQPIYQANGTIVCAGADWGVLAYRLVDGAWAADDLAPNSRPNVFRCNQYGQWGYYTTSGGYPRIVDWRGRMWSNYADVAVSPGGALALKRHSDGGVVVVGALTAIPGLPLAGCTSLSWSDAGLFITVQAIDERDNKKHVRPWLWFEGEPALTDVAINPDEFAIKVVLLNGERWLLVAVGEVLHLRPLGADHGYVLPSMQNADVVWRQSIGKFRVVGTHPVDASLIDLEIDPGWPRYYLGPVIDVTPAPIPEPAPIPSPSPGPSPMPKTNPYPPEIPITTQFEADIDEAMAAHPDFVEREVYRVASTRHARIAYSHCVELVPLDQATIKYRNELRLELGLPPL